MKYYTVIKR